MLSTATNQRTIAAGGRHVPQHVAPRLRVTGCTLHKSSIAFGLFDKKPQPSNSSSSSSESRYPPIPSASDIPSAPPSPAYSSASAPPSPSSYPSFSSEPAAKDSASVVADETLNKLRASAGFMRTLSSVAFWTQLALTTVSAGVLLFAFAVTNTGAHGIDPSKWLTVVGVAFSFISTFFAHGFRTLFNKLANGGKVDPNWLTSNLLRASSLNLWGIGATVIGLQASVGTLVAKALMGAVSGNVMYQNQQNTVVSLDVFTLQASTNTLLCHIIGLVFANWLLRLVNKALPTPAAGVV